MKKNIRLISTLMALTLAISAAACSGNNTTSDKSAPDTKSSITNSSGASASPDTKESLTETAPSTAKDTAGETAGEAAPTEPATDSFSVREGAKSFEAADSKTNSVKNTAEAPAAETPATEAPTEDTFTDMTEFDEAEEEITPVPTEPTTSAVEPDVPPVPDPGQLTAGEWNDNNNRGFFNNLVNNGKITFPSYGIDPRFRTAVTVKDGSDKPVANAKARLTDIDGNVLWEAVTDAKGIAYLFGSDENTGSAVEIESLGKKQSFELNIVGEDTQSKKKSTDRELTVKFDGEGESYAQNEIMFILDTTGSMGDEMLFLQSEFTAITNQIGTENTKYSVNFYRDTKDDYVTKCFDFTDDVSQLQQKLNNESADGGGDLPEAVAEILTETINKSSWSEKSVKLAFLIFDAPPHDEKADEVAAAIRKAAEKGIRIIPVVSSNSDRNTELFARAAAINTGGTYVFLTDDSGIGDSHLEPIIGDYKVEKLYDIIIRVINDYKQK